VSTGARSPAPAGAPPPAAAPGGALRIDVFTIFPAVIDAYCSASLLGRARVLGALDLRVHDLRAGAGDPRRSVDDAPFGGGAGMVLMPEPVFAAVEAVEAAGGLPRPLLLLSPGGPRFDHARAQGLAQAAGGFSLLCGRYEGVDQRVADHLVDGELSVGDFVLAGGEVAALVVVEAVARLLPGVLGNDDSAADESFTAGLLEYPQYTRPASFRGWEVPEILRSGDHRRVARWRRAEALRRTLERRPDLVGARGGLREDEVALLAEHGEMELLARHGYDGEPGSPALRPEGSPPP
jgi:tRNA (guanine37-N1)-methyltransferase